MARCRAFLILFFVMLPLAVMFAPALASAPMTWQATRRPGFIGTYIGLLSRGQTAAAAIATLQAHDPQFNPPADISAGEVAAATLAGGNTPESKRLFCNP